MKKIVAVGVAIALTIASTPPVKGNPVLVAPAAGLCSTGVGCVFVGTVVIGGVLYYVYTHKGKKVYSHQMIDDPDNPENEWIDTTNLKSPVQAEKKCKEIAARHKAVYLRKKRNIATGIFECYFKGGNQ